MNELRVGVVGVGYLGRFHAEKYARMDGVTLVGLADVNIDQARKIASELGTDAYGDHRDLLGRVDAVSVVVPTSLHFAVTRDFLEHGAHTLIEKPMTATLAEADELIRLAESNGLILQVGHLERFNSAVSALQGMVHNPMFIESHRLSMFTNRCTDVSVVLDLMIHDIDIILNCVGSPIKSIQGAGIAVICRQADIANARLEFDNGCVANITASRISTKSERKLRLFQKDAYVSVDFAHHEITLIRPNGGTSGGMIPGMDIQKLSLEKGDALEDEIRSFVQAVARREAPAVTGQMGREALKIALSIMAQIDHQHHRLVG